MAKMKTKFEVNKELLTNFPFLEIVGDYIGANKKTLIRCNDCGFEWEAVPRSVINSKCGCKRCKLSKSKVDRSLNNFLLKYDSNKYELIKFEDHLHVTVKCKKCSYIRTTNTNNIYRYGCPNCSKESYSEKRKMSRDEFIKRAKNLHGDIYSYNKVNYVNYNVPVTIICPIHGEFEQKPSKHLSGLGCPLCAGKNFDTNEFIRRAKEIHGNSYDYSESKYVNAHTPIKITCPKHGVFYLLPYVHFGNQCGCPVCSLSHGEEFIYKFLKESNVMFIQQHRIKNPYNIEELPKEFIADFYLPELNSIIEYNGLQHYMPIEYFGGKLKFEKQVLRDKYLRKYCLENNIKLLEIRYNCKDIKLEISNFLKLPCK